MTPEQMRIALAQAFPTILRRWQQVPGGDFSEEYKDGNGWHQCLEDDLLRDANAALEIVAMMRERGWDFHASNERNVWDASFLHRSLLHNNAACAPTLPLAICEAACKALSL